MDESETRDTTGPPTALRSAVRHLPAEWLAAAWYATVEVSALLFDTLRILVSSFVLYLRTTTWHPRKPRLRS